LRDLREKFRRVLLNFLGVGDVVGVYPEQLGRFVAGFAHFWTNMSRWLCVGVGIIGAVKTLDLIATSGKSFPEVRSLSLSLLCLYGELFLEFYPEWSLLTRREIPSP
jgi:hypothetical protein